MPFRLLLLTLIFIFSGCATLDEDDKNWSANRLYDEGKQALGRQDYETALRHFENLESRFPFGRYTQQAQLDVIYAYYKYNEPDSSIAAADRFIKLYPRHPHVDYAYYMRGRASFSKTIAAFDKLFSLDPTERDSRPQRDAYQYFSELIERFPKSRYAADSAQRMIHLRNGLARYEMHVADYYMRRGAPLAAVNRAAYVIENYPRTPAVADALAVMADGYLKLGKHDLANDSLRVLKTNFPDHAAIKKLEGRLTAKTAAAPAS